MCEARLKFLLQTTLNSQNTEASDYWTLWGCQLDNLDSPANMYTLFLDTKLVPFEKAKKEKGF